MMWHPARAAEAGPHGTLAPNAGRELDLHATVSGQVHRVARVLSAEGLGHRLDLAPILCRLQDQLEIPQVFVDRELTQVVQPIDQTSLVFRIEVKVVRRPNEPTRR